MSARPRTKPLTPDQLKDLFKLAEHADSVELKVTVADEHRQEALGALGVDPLDAQLRQVWFFDTPDLALDKAGLVVRARRSQGGPPDSVVKLRPVVPDDLSPEDRESKWFKVEVDAMPGGYVCSASFKGEMDRDRVRGVAAGNTPIRKLFSKRQRAFFEAHAPDGVGLDDLTALGPINVAKLKLIPDDTQTKFTVEQWFYPNGSRILELSTKCKPGKAPKVADDAKEYLAGRGIDLLGRQEAKTRAALRYFTKG